MGSTRLQDTPVSGAVGAGGDIPDVLYDNATYVFSSAISAGVNAFGSWVQILADVGTGKKLVGINVVVRSAMAETNIAEIEVGEGAAASEVAVSRINTLGTGVIHWIFIPLNRTLTNNARISVRVRDNIGAAIVYRIMIMVSDA